MTATPTKTKPEQILVRVASETYAALQLAQPFVGRRSMQDLVSAVLDDFLTDLRAKDAGFQKAVVGLQESQARTAGVLARRTAGKTQRRLHGD